MKTLRFLVCGGRDYTDEDVLFSYLDKYIKPLTDKKRVVILHGDANGADKLAGRWARRYTNILEERYPAMWSVHGNRAGPIRNQEMLKTGVDCVIACPGGAGTNHMVSIATKKGVKVVHVRPGRVYA